MSGRERLPREALVAAVEAIEQTEAVLKDWKIQRNCSVSPRQFFCFYGLVALVSFTIAITFLLRGAWMVLPFSGLEVLAVGVAFLIHARHAVDYEHIRLSPNRLVVEKMNADRLTSIEFNPRWVRVEADQAGTRIALVSRGQTVSIGEHLAVYKRAQFARELRRALLQCG
jgi:uncharacterized membrane protein